MADALGTAEERATFVLNGLGYGIGKAGEGSVRVRPLSHAAGVHMKHPACAEPAYGLTEPLRDIGKLVRRGAGRVLAVDFPGGEKGAVLLENDARLDQRRIGQQIGQPLGVRTEIP